jgi:hypothetical protein
LGTTYCQSPAEYRAVLKYDGEMIYTGLQKKLGVVSKTFLTQVLFAGGSKQNVYKKMICQLDSGMSSISTET